MQRRKELVRRCRMLFFSLLLFHIRIIAQNGKWERNVRNHIALGQHASNLCYEIEWNQYQKNVFITRAGNCQQKHTDKDLGLLSGEEIGLPQPLNEGGDPSDETGVATSLLSSSLGEDCFLLVFYTCSFNIKKLFFIYKIIIIHLLTCVLDLFSFNCEALTAEERYSLFRKPSSFGVGVELTLRDFCFLPLPSVNENDSNSILLM